MIRTLTVIAAVYLLSACAAKDKNDDGSNAVRLGDPVAASELLLSDAEKLTTTATYRKRGFNSRSDWVSVVMSAMPKEHDSPGAVDGAVGGVGGISGDNKLPDLVAGADVSQSRFAQAKSLGYKRARKFLDQNQWLRDDTIAYVPPVVLAQAMRSTDMREVLLESLRQGAEKPPAVWPPINMGGRYSRADVASMKRDSAIILADSGMSNAMLWLQRLLTAGANRISIYIDSTPKFATIENTKTGDEYGTTGTYLNMDLELVRHMQIRLPGYKPCTIPPKGLPRKNVFHCELDPRPLKRDAT